MEEFHKSQAIILSYELQPQDTSAKAGKESFSWSFPKSYSSYFLPVFKMIVGMVKNKHFNDNFA